MTETCTCPVCGGTGRQKVEEPFAVNTRCYNRTWNVETDTIACRNCGGQTMGGVATGQSRLRAGASLAAMSSPAVLPGIATTSTPALTAGIVTTSTQGTSRSVKYIFNPWELGRKVRVQHHVAVAMARDMAQLKRLTSMHHQRL